MGCGDHLLDGTGGPGRKVGRPVVWRHGSGILKSEKGAGCSCLCEEEGNCSSVEWLRLAS